MCDGTTSLTRCDLHTRDTASRTLRAYEQTHTGGPAVDPLSAAAAQWGLATAPWADVDIPVQLRPLQTKAGAAELMKDQARVDLDDAEADVVRAQVAGDAKDILAAVSAATAARDAYLAALERWDTAMTALTHYRLNALPA